MTTVVQIELPDQLAQEAQRAGLLSTSSIEATLREQLRAAHVGRLAQAREQLAAEPLPAMTGAEIRADIDAYRNEQRRASQALQRIAHS